MITQLTKLVISEMLAFTQRMVEKYYSVIINVFLNQISQFHIEYN
jgi:hypothetical protein